MKSTWIAAVTALALLAQGFVMASASAAEAFAPPAAEAAASQMPCHDDGDASADTHGAAPCDCCTSGCMFACGGVPLPALLSAGAAPAPDHPSPAAALDAPLASHSLTPFRPPAA